MDVLSELKRDPRYTLLATLAILLAYNFATSSSSLSFLLPLLVTVVVAVIIEIGLFFFVDKRSLAIPLSAVITGLIVSIVLTPSFTTIHFSLLAVTIALLSKRFIKIGFAHVFNPGNLGSLAAAVFSTVPIQSWWAASNPLLIGVLGAVILYRVNAWLITVPFLLATLLLEGARMTMFGTVNPDFLFSTIFSGTILFFATVMLVEPMTTPSLSWSKTVFGILAAVLNFAFSFILPELSFLAALAVSNISVQFLDNLFTPHQQNEQSLTSGAT